MLKIAIRPFTMITCKKKLKFWLSNDLINNLYSVNVQRMKWLINTKWNKTICMIKLQIQDQVGKTKEDLLSEVFSS